MNKSAKGADVALEIYRPRAKENPSFAGEVECGRYLTITGNVYGEEKPIAERTEVLKELILQYFPDKPQPQPSAPPSPTSLSQSDKEIIEKMFSSKSGYEIKALWNGDLNAYGTDHSIADFALLSHLAYWTNGDEIQMDRLFRQSSLFASMKEEHGVKKWDCRHGYETYGKMTIHNVLKSFTPYLSETKPLLPAPPMEAKKGSTDENIETERAEYNASSTSSHIDAFFNDIDDRAKMPSVSTGLPSLDELLGGQLSEGLYVLGAVSSQGKTTLGLQIADNVAAAGNDTLFFSLEQGEYELMAKSVSRTTYELVCDKSDISLASTSHFILTKADWKDASPQKNQLVQTAAEKYKTLTDGHLHIFESIGDLSTSDVRVALRNHEKMTGKTPSLIVIDYLQIMKSADARATDKQNCDSSMHELKRLSRDYRIPIIIISSFNRQSYGQPVDFTCFKESGAIEYGCDVLLALQYDGMDYLEGESEKDKSRAERIKKLKSRNEDYSRNKNAVPIQIKVLKNRCGPKGSTVLNYLHCYNVFLDPKASPPASPQMNVWD